jgi:2-polyprenyl-3-methyl-5-hydroxy-6-metoxy-1,4-benzoquinol methylase
LAGNFSGGALYFDTADQADRIRTVAAAGGLHVPGKRLVSRLGEEDRWDVVVLDRRVTSREEYLRFGRHGTVVGIDEGGEAREFIPYLIDTLPLPPGRSKANIFSTGFQARPKDRREANTPATGKVLISFGGEDPEGLTGTMARALIHDGHFTPDRLTVVVGPLFRPTLFPAGVNLLDSPKRLRELLSEYDVVFTSFGLTAYEAVNSGVSVVLLNPTNYHRTLSRTAGFPEVGVGSVNRVKLRRLLSARMELLSTCAAIATGARKSITAHIDELSFESGNACPVCGERGNRAVGRFVDRSFFRCGRCSVVYELDFSKKRRRYNTAYFSEDYREQYGKTYLEDFDTIRRASRRRVGRIRKLGGPLGGKRVLDVGCAFGPFLVEARQASAEVYGVDVAEEPVVYVRETLRLPCERASFETLDLRAAFGIRAVDVITMWYVIEHFPAVGRILSKINALLTMGGEFAFSTPNLSGISGRTDFDRFLANSPSDHFTLWNPRIARSVLGRYGFRVLGFHVTGHHPERFRLFSASRGWKYELLRRYSEAARLGDTFECYAVKETEITQ